MSRNAPWAKLTLVARESVCLPDQLDDAARVLEMFGWPTTKPPKLQ